MFLLIDHTSAPVTASRASNVPTRYLNLIVVLVVIARCAWIFGALLRSHDLPLQLAQDDFYYYLKPAQNLAWFHQSAAFQHTLTNGYHPLYFLVLTAMSFFVRTLPGVFRFLWVLDIVSASAIFLITRRLFTRTGSLLLANGLAILMTSLSITQICDQMEVTLAIPLGLAFLLAGFADPSEYNPRRTALLGLLGALTFLARLDAGLLVFFFIAGLVCQRAYRRALSPEAVLAFLGACLPLPLLYFFLNVHFFHTLLPISGMAKELRHGNAFSFLLPASFSGTSEFLVNLAVISAVLTWAIRRQLLAREKALLLASLLTPFVFYVLEMRISDWPVWNWYFYVLRFAAVGFGTLVCIFATRPIIPLRFGTLRSVVQSSTFAALLGGAAMLKLLVANYNVDHWMVEIQHATGILDQFARTHPGVYAMGDRAGMFTITTPNPVLQAEGLVMDRRYLEHIKAQDDLRSVLASYGVNYYVAFVFARNYPSQFRGGCFRAMEPSIAGPSSLRMRSLFCEAPVFQFPGFDGKYMIFRIHAQ